MSALCLSYDNKCTHAICLLFESHISNMFMIGKSFQQYDCRNKHSISNLTVSYISDVRKVYFCHMTIEAIRL